MKLRTFLFSLVIIGMISCKNNSTSNSKSIDYDKAATELCNCMKPLIDLNKRVEELVSQGKTDDVAAIFAEVESLAEETEACALKVEEKYGKIEGEVEKKMEAALKKTCPEISETLDKAKNLME